MCGKIKVKNNMLIKPRTVFLFPQKELIFWEKIEDSQFGLTIPQLVVLHFFPITQSSLRKLRNIVFKLTSMLFFTLRAFSGCEKQVTMNSLLKSFIVLY